MTGPQPGLDEQADTIRVLHVDDEPDFAELVATYLEREDERFLIETATTAREGLERLADDRFDCVVSDYDMPGRNGIEFLETVRENHPELPFVLYTGKGSEEVASEAISAGVTDYIQKQTGTDQYAVLANRLCNAVERYRATQTRDRQHAAIESAREGISILNADGEFIYVNRTYADLYGYEPEEMVGEHWELIYPDDEVGFARAEILPTVADEGYWHGETTGLRADGTTFPEDHVVSQTANDELVCTVRDLSDRRERETELRTKTRAMDKAPIGITITGPGQADNPLTYVNERFEDVTGYDREEILGQNCRVLQGERTADEPVVAMREAIDAKEPVTVELRNYRKDGTEFWNRVTIAPVRNEDGEVTNWVGFQEDTTARKERERAIEQLHSTARAFMEAETEGDVADITIDALEHILDMPASGVHLYDEREDGLVPIAWTARTEELVDEPPTFAPGEGIAGRAFETGEARRYDDISTVPHRYNPDTEVRSEIVLPLAEHGVLVIGSTHPAAFDDTDVGLARTLAAHATTALGRIEDERSLREYETLVETVGDPMYVLDAEGNIEMANGAMLEYFDADREAVVGSSIREFVAEGDFGRATDLIRELLSDPDRDWATLEFTAVPPTGDRFPAELNLAVVTDDAGDFTGSVGVVRDISERKAHEQQLELERDRLESLFEAIPEPVVEVEFTDDGPLLRDVNEAFETTFGYESPEAIGEDINDLIVPDDSAARATAETIDERADAGEQLTREVRRETTDGVRDFLFRSAPIDRDGKTNRQFGLYIDITERKERERSLERLQHRTQALMHTTTREETAQVAVETAHDVLGAQLSGCHLLGPAEQTLEPAAFVDTVREELGDAPTYTRTADDDPASRVVWQVFESGDPLVIDDTREFGRLADATPARSAIIHPLGGHGVFILSATEPNAFGDTDETLTEIIATSLEGALERVEREQTLARQNERLDQFASVVSHDLRNPLNVAQGRLELAREERDSQHLVAVAGAIDRSLSLIDDLLVLAREGDRVSEMEAVDLGTLADGCWRNVETADGTLVIDTERTIRADESRLKQLLENLFTNAVEHGGADVTVTVGDLDDCDGFYVSDDGPGIPVDEPEQVFEPGYSTTADGTGFGLNIVREIAEAHGWEIRVTDGREGGARFEITGVEADRAAGE